MDPRIQLRTADFGSVKAKAVDDARQMQIKVIEECKRAGKDPPPYGLEELIGKGSFGRVYKGKDMKSAATVAVKIIDIDESDTLNPRNADSYSEFLKEVNALKILSESKAKNINHVIEALPVNHAMWMITEHCGGGSVATLMKPTAPGGLQERWIIPILREVAEAIKWVHNAQIIHRDIKCGNILVTEQGGVQLCDFGVAGINENKNDKRLTIIGTPHWMAPELLDKAAAPSYGKEVDIWAFGAAAYEMATGLPPNATKHYDQLGDYLKLHLPKLEGDQYSTKLKSLVAYCFERDPKSRPSIEQVQKHDYIANSGAAYPTSGLRALVASFRVWESRGGSRKSLFFQHGAQNGSPSQSPLDDEWNFSTTEVFDRSVQEEFTAKDVFAVYGPSVVDFGEETARPSQLQVRRGGRRPPPEALGRLPAQPLEKIFDPNTMSNYNENSREHYGGAPRIASQSDLPLRDNSHATIRDTQIDLGSHDAETGISTFIDMDTIKAQRRDDGENKENSDFSRPALSDPVDNGNRPRTQDWSFAAAASSMAPPASADPEISRFPATFDQPRPPIAGTPISSSRPPLFHHTTEPVGGAFGTGPAPAPAPAPDRRSMNSLIDLDASVPDPTDLRPSTANSDAGSATSEHATSTNPFEFERHASIYQPTAAREPSLYVSDDFTPALRQFGTMSLNDPADISDFSASDADTTRANAGRQGKQAEPTETVTSNGTKINSTKATPATESASREKRPTTYRSKPIKLGGPPPSGAGQLMFGFTPSHRPTVPPQPAGSALTGKPTSAELRAELNRIVLGMHDQMVAFKKDYEATGQPMGRGRGSGENGEGPSSGFSGLGRGTGGPSGPAPST